MTCSEVEKILLAMDSGSIPPEIAIHLDRCEKCRLLARRFARTEEAVRATPEEDPLLVEAIMERVLEAPEGTQDAREVDIENTSAPSTRIFAGWLLGGIVLLAAMIAIRHNASFRYLTETVYGHTVDIAVSLAIGTILVTYLAAFVLGNAGRLQHVLGEWHEKGRTP